MSNVIMYLSVYKRLALLQGRTVYNVSYATKAPPHLTLELDMKLRGDHTVDVGLPPLISRRHTGNK